MLKLRLKFTIVFVLTILQGCGFHLRGTVETPSWLNHVAVVIENGHRELKPLLLETLHANNVSTCKLPDKAKFLLVITNDALKQQITSVSSTTTSRQYQLTYQVSFKLIDANGVEIIRNTHVNSIRQQTVNYNQMLGSNQEEELLKSEMRQGAVRQILSRISKVKYLESSR